MSYHATLQGVSALGKLERRSPLPVGAYAFTNTKTAALPNTATTYPRFQAWLKENSGSVKVRATETSNGEFDGKPATMDLYVFEVKSPVAWPADEIGGWPDIVEGDINDAVRKYGQGDGDQFWWDWLAEKMTPPDDKQEAAMVSSIILLALGIGAGLYILKNTSVLSKKEARA